jgi:hypothetical protein
MVQKIWIALGLFLVLSLALAGCGQRITAEEIVAKMQETIENTKYLPRRKYGKSRLTESALRFWRRPSPNS